MSRYNTKMKFNWEKLNKPFFTLAPMEGATDTVFRQIVASCARPDVFFTEFTNVQGLLSLGNKQVAQRLKFEKSEHPIIAQIWGIAPDAFFESAKLIVEMGFDGIDINMGCPERNIVKKGSCAGLIRNPELASKIIEQTKKGAGDLPVSVKTRLGFSQFEPEWIEFLLKQDLSALTIHLRTVKEMSKVPAHWEMGKEIVELRNKVSPSTILIGNGDVENVSEGKERIRETGFDGIMIGRGVFHNPYAFSEKIDFHNLNREEKINLLKKHLDLFEKTWLEEKHFAPLKRYFKIYINGFDGASDLREKLMETNSIDEARGILRVTGLD